MESYGAIGRVLNSIGRCILRPGCGNGFAAFRLDARQQEEDPPAFKREVVLKFGTFRAAMRDLVVPMSCTGLILSTAGRTPSAAG